MAIDIAELPDSGFMMLSTNELAADSAFVLTRLNKWGEQVWSRQYKLDEPEQAAALFAAPDEGYYVMARTTIVRVDSSGNLIWSKEYDIWLDCAAETRAGGLVVASSYPLVFPNEKVAVLKIDSSGNVVWSTLVDTLVNEGVQGIQAVPLPNGTEDYVIIGRCYQEYGFFNVVTRLSENGILQWNRLYSPNLIFYTIALTADSCVIICGYAQGLDSLAGITGMLLMKLDNADQPVFTKVMQSAFGTFVTTRSTTIGITGGTTTGSAFALVFDSSLTTYWFRKYNYPAGTLSCSYPPLLLHDGGIAMLARAYATGPSPTMRFLRTDANGILGCSEAPLNDTWQDINWTDSSDYVQVPLTVNVLADTVSTTVFDISDSVICTSVGIDFFAPGTMAFTVTPNPASGFFSVESGSTNPLHLELYDSFGKLILINDNYHNGERVYTESLHAGLYILRIDGNPCKLIVR